VGLDHEHNFLFDLNALAFESRNGILKLSDPVLGVLEEFLSLALRFRYDDIGLASGVFLHLVQDLLGVQQGAFKGSLPTLVLFDVELQLFVFVGQPVDFALQIFEAVGRLLQKGLYFFGCIPAQSDPKALLLDVKRRECHMHSSRLRSPHAGGKFEQAGDDKMFQKQDGQHRDYRCEINPAEDDR
jgi:hypothetical protein